jgi:hypothetical protein
MLIMPENYQPLCINSTLYDSICNSFPRMIPIEARVQDLLSNLLRNYKFQTNFKIKKTAHGGR